MRITLDFEDEFNTLVTRGQIQIIGLREVVNSIKRYAEHTQSEEFRSAVHQIEEKINPILGCSFVFRAPNRLRLRNYTASNSHFEMLVLLEFTP